jgi:hypothetical protein
MKTFTKWLAGLSVLSILLFFACQKENSRGSSGIPPGESKVSVYLMDDPIQFYKVLIDIRQVRVEVDTASNQATPDEDDQWDDDYCGWHRDRDHKSLIWDTLSITPGVYNLLDLRNGTDTLLGSGLYTTGKILKLEITLGSDNSVYTDSLTSYPLEVYGRHPYFTINVRREDVSSVTNNEFQMWLDFNLAKSIFFWSGEFLLRPNIIVFNDHMMAKLQGQVLPPWAGALVSAYSGSDTLYAIPGDHGYYQIRGVPAGTYSINIKGRNGYQDTTINNIVVDSGMVTTVPTITLHQ